eukprot:scaffold101942_cov28-Tisochrysis_lutea.AAC.3
MRWRSPRRAARASRPSTPRVNCGKATYGGTNQKRIACSRARRACKPRRGRSQTAHRAFHHRLGQRLASRTAQDT